MVKKKLQNSAGFPYEYSCGRQPACLSYMHKGQESWSWGKHIKGKQ